MTTFNNGKQSNCSFSAFESKTPATVWKRNRAFCFISALTACWVILASANVIGQSTREYTYSGGKLSGVQESSNQPQNCTYTLPKPASTSQDLPAGGGTYNFTVTYSDANCAAPALARDVAWINNVAVNSSNTVTKTVSYTVDANGGNKRTGNITVAGQSYKVSQAKK